MKTIADWTREVHENAVAKGFYDKGPRSALEAHMLIVSEIAEATESARKDEPPIWGHEREYIGGFGFSTIHVITPEHPSWDAAVKPEGELTELADAVIRILDYCGARGWDLERAMKLKHEYNKSRPYRHGGKLA